MRLQILTTHKNKEVMENNTLLKEMGLIVKNETLV